MTACFEFPNSFVYNLKPLCPGEGLGDEADGTLMDLAEHGFVAALGVHERQVGALACMGAQDHIREYCPNDMKRFGGTLQIMNWLSKGRQMVGIYTREDRLHYSLDELPTVDTNRLWQVAYGWLGPEANKYIPAADITTAYRVGESGRRLSRERRHGAADTFKLGLPLGRLVSAVAIHKYDIAPSRISLETWASNGANDLYDVLGFVQPVGLEPIKDERPTLKTVGSEINGHTVYRNAERAQNMVTDYRLHKVLQAAV